MKKNFFCFVLVGIMAITCKANTHLNTPDEVEKEDVDINVTFKVDGNFGYLEAVYKDIHKETVSGAAISVKKDGVVNFLAKPMDGFEVKMWKIENGKFTEGGTPKSKNAKVLAKEDFKVSVEFKVIEGQEEPSTPFTIQSLNIGNQNHLKLTEEKYKETMDKIKDGDENQILESIALNLDLSIWTQEEMKEVFINEKKYSPDLGEPHFFKGCIDVPETKTKFKITLKGKKKESILTFFVQKIEGKIAFPESELKLLIDGNEVNTHIYNHLSDIDENTWPLIETTNNNLQILLKTQNPFLAGKVAYEHNEYKFDDTSMEASFNISDITENEKLVKMEISPKKEDGYEKLIWNFKVKKVKVVNFVPAYLYIDNELVPDEIKDNLTSTTPKTLEQAGEKALISVRTFEAQAIDSVTIDGKLATFRKKKTGMKYRYEAEIENIKESEREIVIVITPKEGKNYDKTTWKFKIKKMESIDLKDIFLYIDGVSVSDEIASNLTNETTPPTIMVNKENVVVAVKKITSDDIESVSINGSQASKSTETSPLYGEEIYVFSLNIITTDEKHVEIIITPKDLIKHKILKWQFNIKKE